MSLAISVLPSSLNYFGWVSTNRNCYLLPMGAICAGGPKGSPDERKTSAQIDSDLRQFRKEYEHGSFFAIVEFFCIESIFLAAMSRCATVC